MVHQRRQTQPDFTNDLRPHVECCVRFFPRTQGQSGPAFGLIGSVSHSDLCSSCSQTSLCFQIVRETSPERRSSLLVFPRAPNGRRPSALPPSHPWRPTSSAALVHLPGTSRRRPPEPASSAWTATVARNISLLAGTKRSKPSQLSCGQDPSRPRHRLSDRFPHSNKPVPRRTHPASKRPSPPPTLPP